MKRINWDRELSDMQAAGWRVGPRNGWGPPPTGVVRRFLLRLLFDRPRRGGW